jgi:hypothetical protein
MPSHLPSHAFFLDAIKEIYDKDSSPSRYLFKKNIHVPLCVACNALHNWSILCCLDSGVALLIKVKVQSHLGHGNHGVQNQTNQWVPGVWTRFTNLLLVNEQLIYSGLSKHT